MTDETPYQPEKQEPPDSVPPANPTGQEQRMPPQTPQGNTYYRPAPQFSPYKKVGNVLPGVGIVFSVSSLLALFMEWMSIDFDDGEWILTYSWNAFDIIQDFGGFQPTIPLILGLLAAAAMICFIISIVMKNWAFVGSLATSIISMILLFVFIMWVDPSNPTQSEIFTVTAHTGAGVSLSFRTSIVEIVVSSIMLYRKKHETA